MLVNLCLEAKGLPNWCARHIVCGCGKNWIALMISRRKTAVVINLFCSLEKSKLLITATTCLPNSDTKSGNYGKHLGSRGAIEWVTKAIAVIECFLLEKC